MTSVMRKGGRETACGRGRGTSVLGVKVLVLAGFAGLWRAPVRGQTSALDSQTTPGMAWHGDLSQWTWHNHPNSDFEGVATMGRWQLDATIPGVHVVWGCPTEVDTNGSSLISPHPPLGNPSHPTAFHALWHWQQGVSGSQANRSEWMWAMPPTPDPVESARMLAESTQSGWMDGHGGMGAGSTGSDDPLMCWAPDMVAWQVASGCHSWGHPFELGGWMTWGTNGQWQASAVDAKGRMQALVDTVMAQTPSSTALAPPCVGWRVDCTSSNLDSWSFGVRVGAGNPDTAVTTPLYSSMLSNAEASVNLVEPLPSSAVTHPSALSLIVQPANLVLPPLTQGPRCPEVPGSTDLGGGSADGSGMSSGMSSVIPRQTACHNVWDVQLPCPLPAEHPSRLSFGGHDIHMWPEGTSLLLPGQIAFTEIMADPTPATHAPESTYLELINLSSLAIQVSSLVLRDGGEHHALVPWNDKLWLPGEVLLLVDNLDPWRLWDDPAQSEFHVAKVSSWSGLRDDGESIALMRGNVVLESLTYEGSWWLPGSQDGISLSAIQPEGCDHPDNWKPDQEGASPGRFSAASTSHAPPEPLTGNLTLMPWFGDSVWMSPSPPWDNRKEVWVAMRDSDQSAWSLLQAVRGEDQTWRLAAPKSTGQSRTIHIQITTPLCLHPEWNLRVDTMWRMHPLPRREDLVLTEVHANPSIGAEFIEWMHLRDDTLAWGQSAWAPGQCLVQSPETKAHFEGWHWEAWQDRIPPIWEVRSEVKLPNQGGQLELEDPWQRAMPLVIHSPCDHDRSSGPESGRSVEWFSSRAVNDSAVQMQVQSTRTCPHPLGSSPGWVDEVWDEEDPWPNVDRPPSHPLAPTGLWGCVENAWVVIPAVGTDPGLFQPHLWSPATSWSWTRCRGMPAVTSPIQINSAGDPILPKHESVPSLSCPQSMSSNDPPHLGTMGLEWATDTFDDRMRVHWNEWLQSPVTDFCPFVEVWNPNPNPVMTRDLVWSSSEDEDPASFESPASDIDWILPPQKASCFGTCPMWVQHGSGICIPADIPSLHGERELRLRHRGMEDVVTLGREQHSPWVAEDDGISMGRLPDSDLWTSTPAHIGSTPGRTNNLPDQVENPRKQSRLSCSPYIIQPGLGEDLVFAEVSLPLHALCHLEWFVHPVERLQADHAMMEPIATMTTGLGLGTWAWRGDLANEQPASPGNHMITVRWQCPRTAGVEEGGVLLQGVDRCLITVTP